MNAAVPDCLVRGYEGLIPELTLPDEADRHVLAAAVHSASEAIVTINLKDFPTSQLAKFEIEAVHPDDFILGLCRIDLGAAVSAAARCRSRLNRPRKSAKEYLDVLESCGLMSSAGELRRRVEEL